MAFNLTEVFTSLQKRIYNSDSDTNTQELLYFLKAALRGDQNTVYAVDTKSDLPNLLDDSADTESTIYVRSDEKLYFKQSGQWKPLRPYQPPKFQGTSGAFVMGGGSTSPHEPTIQYYPFANPFTTTSAIGNLTVARGYATGVRDITSENSYVAGGYQTGGAGSTSILERFPNAISISSVTNVGNLSATSHNNAGIASPAFGFVHMGIRAGVPTTKIDRFSFSSGATSGTDYGNITTSLGGQIAISDIANGKGYVRMNGTTMEAFPTAASSPFTATVAGNDPVIPYSPGEGGGWNSEDFGYWMNNSAVSKFPFAAATPITISVIPGTPANDIIQVKGAPASSTTDGYIAGFSSPSPAPIGSVLKRPFANDTSSSRTQNALVYTSPNMQYVAGSHF